MIIAVDFDGTIVEHRYPEIGREKPFAFDTLKMLQKEGHRLILWTVREDKLLEEAVDSADSMEWNFMRSIRTIRRNRRRISILAKAEGGCVH